MAQSNYRGNVYPTGDGLIYCPSESTTGQHFPSWEDLRDHLRIEGYPRVEFLPGEDDEYFEVIDVIDLGGKAERWLIAAERAEALRVELAAALAASDRRGVSASKQRRQVGQDIWEQVVDGVRA